MIGRARLFFFVACIVAAVIVGTNFPFVTLWNERSTINAAGSEIRSLHAESRSLESDLRRLGDRAFVERIAGEYDALGSTPGPSAGSKAGSTARGRPRGGWAAGPLGDHLVPPGDLQPSDAMLGPSPPPVRKGGHEASFWSRVLGQLEFWHALF
jgi:hypothetical protein